MGDAGQARFFPRTTAVWLDALDDAVTVFTVLVFLEGPAVVLVPGAARLIVLDSTPQITLGFFMGVGASEAIAMGS